MRRYIFTGSFQKTKDRQQGFKLIAKVLTKFAPVQTGVNRGSFSCYDPRLAVPPKLAQGGLSHLGPFLRPSVNNRFKSINGEELNAYIQSESSTKH